MLRPWCKRKAWRQSRRRKHTKLHNSDLMFFPNREILRGREKESGEGSFFFHSLHLFAHSQQVLLRSAGSGSMQVSIARILSSISDTVIVWWWPERTYTASLMHPSSAVLRLKANHNNNHRFHLFKTSKLLNKERVLQE